MVKDGEHNFLGRRRPASQLLAYARGEGGWGRAVALACVLLLVNAFLQYGFVGQWWWETLRQNLNEPRNRRFAVYLGLSVPLGWLICVGATLVLCRFRLGRYLLPMALVCEFAVSAGYDYFAYLPAYFSHLPASVSDRAQAAGYVSRMLANQAESAIAGLAVIWMAGQREYWWPGRSSQAILWQRLVRWASVYLWIIPAWKLANQVLVMIDKTAWQEYTMATFWGVLLVAGLVLRSSWQRRNLVAATLIAAGLAIRIGTGIWTVRYSQEPTSIRVLMGVLAPPSVLASAAGFVWWLLMQRETRPARVSTASSAM